MEQTSYWNCKCWSWNQLILLSGKINDNSTYYFSTSIKLNNNNNKIIVCPLWLSQIIHKCVETSREGFKTDFMNEPSNIERRFEYYRRRLVEFNLIGSGRTLFSKLFLILTTAVYSMILAYFYAFMYVVVIGTITDHSAFRDIVGNSMLNEFYYCIPLAFISIIAFRYRYK